IHLCSEYTPRLIKSLEGVKVLLLIKTVAAGMLHSACIDGMLIIYYFSDNSEKGCVFIFGERSTNELEIGEGKNIRTPTVVREIPDSEEVACGGYHTCIVTSNVFNQLPNWLLVACGWKHTAVISVYYVNVKVATSLPGAGEVLVEHFLRIAILLEDNL
ncbi:hypothetical protein B296_00022934, partial [Ensete ventricosum]